MNIFKIICIVSLFIASQANATTFDFLTEANSYERGVSSFTYDTMTVTGTKSGDSTAFVYFDSGDAGLGVCGTLSGVQCSPGDDDNVTSGEFLTFSFSVDTWIDSISVNSNHDSTNYFQYEDSPTDTVLLNGNSTYVTTYGSKIDYNDLIFDRFMVSAGEYFTLAYDNKQFYVSKIDFAAAPVPEPATMLLFGTGLVGLAGVARRRKQ